MDITYEPLRKQTCNSKYLDTDISEKNKALACFVHK